MSTPYPIVALWCVPRSVSTAFERMMAARGDFTMFSEPFSDAYYFASNRVSERFDIDPAISYKSFEDSLENIKSAAQQGPVFFKDMAYHVQQHLSAEFLSDFINVVLVRDPRFSLASLYRRMPDFTLEETGFDALTQLVGILDAAGKAPFVMDGDILRADPERVSREFCRAVDIPFSPDALSWSKGDEQHWDRWQDWFSEASASTQFSKPRDSFDTSTLAVPHVADALEQCMPHYESISERVIQHSVATS
ncbi:MAG: hypothetical protein ABJ056_03550 [Halioglobus sp.]